MPTGARGVKDNSLVECGSLSHYTSIQWLVPEFNLAAIALMPIIQVDEEVDSSNHFQFLVPVEIRMDFQEATRRDIMQSTTLRTMIWV